MSITRDWLPGTRTEQLTMARNWQDVLQTSGTGWQVPTATLMQLRGGADAAERLAERTEKLHTACIKRQEYWRTQNAGS